MSRHREMLAIRDLVVRYDDTAAVDGVSLDVERYALTVLVGPSGCGKTSVLRTVAGFEAPVLGTVEIDGTVVVGPGRWVEPERRQVGMVFQQGALFPHLTVLGNVRFGLPGDGEGARRADAAIELVGLSAYATRYPDQLSGGQQQLVALARALAPFPKVILLDEPFANLDAALRIRLREKVRSILDAAHITSLMVTHDQEEALSVADRIAVMAHGRLLQVGTPQEVYHDPASPDVARFIGGGQLIDCEVESGRVKMSLGSLATSAPDGPGQLLVRPEDLTLFTEGDSEGVRAEVVRRCFYGHDLIEEVRLTDGECLQVRVPSHLEREVGAAVRVGLRDKPFRIFHGNGDGPFLCERIRLRA